MGWQNWFSSRKMRHAALHQDQDGLVPRLPSGRGRDRQDDRLPRFQGTAGDQIRSGTRNSGLDRIRFHLRNAFTPAQPVFSHKMFAGRTEVLRTLIRSIEDQRLHVVLYGDRGIGKTSLLHILAQLARDARYIVRYASCGEETEFSDMMRAIARDIPLLYHADFAPTSAEIESGRSLADLLPKGTLTVPQISDLFAKVSNTRVLLILDEFDRAQSHSFRRSIAELIKNLSDRSSRVQIVIAGVAANLTELIEHIPSIRRNILGLQVPNMSNSEIEELIHNGEKICGMTFDRDAIAFISAVAYGSPYIASLLGQHAGLAAVDRQATAVEKADVAEAINRSFDEIRQRVSSLSIYQASKAKADGHGANLGLLARLALHYGGRVLPQQADEVIRKQGQGMAYMQKIAAEYGLLEPLANDPAGAFHFSEEGVAVYLWIELAQAHFAGSQSNARLLDALLDRYAVAQNA